jgi:hypothetical protein
MSHAQRSGQSCGRAWNCAYRDSFSICASLQPKLSQIYAILANLEKRNLHFVGSTGRQPCAAPNSQLCAAHIGTGARVDFDVFAFLDEQRDVDGLAGLKLCRFGNVAGGVTAKPFW